LCLFAAVLLLFGQYFLNDPRKTGNLLKGNSSSPPLFSAIVFQRAKKFVLDYGGVMRQKLALIVIFAAASLGCASAQGNPSPTPTPTPPPCPNPEPPCPPSGTNDARLALACEWLDPNSIPNVLKALKLYIENSRGNANAVLSALEDGAHCNKDKDKSLYNAALGYPDKNGDRTTRGRPDVLDILATANTLKIEAMDKATEDALGKTPALIKRIYDSGAAGVQALAEIDNIYQDSPQLAIYKLLNAFPQFDENHVAYPTYVQDLEILRAACEKNRDKVFKSVSDQVYPQEKQKAKN
jgi:hypothetical protein